MNTTKNDTNKQDEEITNHGAKESISATMTMKRQHAMLRPISGT
jgi:hypothetical protein